MPFYLHHGGSSCNACTNTSVSSLLFLLLAQITAAITVIATSTHTMSNIPPTPADIAAAVFVLWTVELGVGVGDAVELEVGVGDAIQYKEYCCLVYYLCSVPYLQQHLRRVVPASVQQWGSGSKMRPVLLHSMKPNPKATSCGLLRKYANTNSHSL